MKKSKGFHPIEHLKNLGFTNRLAVYLVAFLIIGLLGGFYLAIRSIDGNYTGQLLCWTIVFGPVGTAVSIVLGKIVDKNRDENTGGNGDGITYAAAKANNFVSKKRSVYVSPTGSENSPGI